MDLPVATLAIASAVRLVATRRLRDPALLRLVGAELAGDLAEIAGATSARRLEERRSGWLMPGGRPDAGFVNAAFAYFRPRELNRFNGPDRGAWYAAFATETALAEVAFHIRRELDRVRDWRATVEYAELWASFAGAFVDLRGLHPAPPCLDPDPAIGYPAGNRVAQDCRDAGLNGIVYPSVRHADGTCLAALWPHVVQSVRHGAVLRLIWAGRPQHTVEAVT